MKSLTINNFAELPFDLAEAVNQLRVNLSFTDASIKKIVVTSSVPNEGKSFIALNLWRAMALTGKKVLFVDCDLRASEIIDIYDIHSSDTFYGIAHALSGQCPVQEVMYKTNIPNGYMIPSVNAVSNPSTLLETKYFKEVLDQVAGVFDYVIIDTPPVGTVADALTIGKAADGNIVIVRSGYTKKALVKDTLDSLKITNKPLLGIVLNRVDVSRNGSYYYKGYGSYYGNYTRNQQKKKTKKKAK